VRAHHSVRQPGDAAPRAGPARHGGALAIRFARRGRHPAALGAARAHPRTDRASRSGLRRGGDGCRVVAAGACAAARRRARRGDNDAVDRGGARPRDHRLPDRDRSKRTHVGFPGRVGSVLVQAASGGPLFEAHGGRAARDQRRRRDGTTASFRAERRMLVIPSGARNRAPPDRGPPLPGRLRFLDSAASRLRSE